MRGKHSGAQDGEPQSRSGMSRRTYLQLATAAAIPAATGLDDAKGTETTNDGRVRYGQNAYGDSQPI